MKYSITHGGGNVLRCLEIYIFKNIKATFALSKQ